MIKVEIVNFTQSSLGLTLLFQLISHLCKVPQLGNTCLCYRNLAIKSMMLYPPFVFPILNILMLSSSFPLPYIASYNQNMNQNFLCNNLSSKIGRASCRESI